MGLGTDTPASLIGGVPDSARGPAENAATRRTHGVRSERACRRPVLGQRRCRRVSLGSLDSGTRQGSASAFGRARHHGEVASGMTVWLLAHPSTDGYVEEGGTMTDEEPPAADHSAAASVLGYLHQTRWGLLELLRSPSTNPDQTLSLEMHDDVAWEIEGTPADLKQLKLHVNSVRNLTNASDDMWRTLRVWMDNGRPGDPYGPTLTLITNSTAGEGSAASLLRDNGRDTGAALAILESTATTSTAEATAESRRRFLALSPSERSTFVDRIRIADQSPDLDGVDEEVAARLRPGAPTEQFDTYMDLVWAWWGRTSLSMLSGRRPPVSVAESDPYQAT